MVTLPVLCMIQIGLFFAHPPLDESQPVPSDNIIEQPAQENPIGPMIFIYEIQDRQRWDV